MEDFIITRAAKNIKNVEKLHTVTAYKMKKPLNSTETFEKNENVSNKSKKQDKNENADVCDKRTDERSKQELEMKRYRYDIIKFGMSGLDKHNAQQAKAALAISLGARPPKNKRKNYKKLIGERKKEQVRQVKKEKFASGFDASKLLMKYKKQLKPNLKKYNNKKSNGILNVYGKVVKEHNKSYKRKTKKNVK